MTDMKKIIKEKPEILISVILLSICALVLFLTVYFRPALGDDILEQFKCCDKWYNDDPTWVELPPKNTWKAAWEDAWYLYNHWSGRVIYLLSIAMLTIWGQISVAIGVTLIYLVIVLAGGRLVFGSLPELFMHPVSVGVISSLIMLYNYTMDHSTMWTFAGIYGTAYAFYLVDLNCTIDIIRGRLAQDKSLLVKMNILGLLAGLTHELLGAWYILQLIIIYLVSFGFKKTLKHVKYYYGMMVGYAICFFAPGNFVRAGSRHDAGLHSSWFHRLFEGASQHGQCILKMQNGGIVIGVLLILCTFAALVKIDPVKLKAGKNRFIFYIGAILMSWIIWSIMAYTPVYGMVGMLMYVILLCIEIIRASRLRILDYGRIIGIALGLLLIIDNGPWIYRFGTETAVRNRLIEEAKANGESEVHVPAYSEKVCRHVVFDYYTNSSDMYGCLPETKFFGIKIVVDDTDS